MNIIEQITVKLNELEDQNIHSMVRSSQYRSAPFWAWNDKLEKNELVRQINTMKEQGMGGYFIHSREGLETPYLSEEWMQAVKDAVHYSEKIGLEAWIYDEDKWPSGSAGGAVSQQNPLEYTAKAITLELIEVQSEKDLDFLSDFSTDNLMSCYLINVDTYNSSKEIEDFFEIDITKIDRLRNNFRQIDQDWVIQKARWKLAFLRKEISGSSEWYNGSAPSDNLNPNAVRAFINSTHEIYKSNCGEHFGQTIKGFFTDEPNFCDFFSVFTDNRAWIPWTDGLVSYFKEKRDYDICSNLIWMFFQSKYSNKIRHDYWRTLTELFSETYMKQVYNWCENEGLKLTGHMLYENDLGYQTRVCGAAMPHYRYLHAPGIDILGEQTQEYLTVKQCTSVAHQYGRDQVVSETYGCTGWEFTFEGQKWLGDWQYIMGVNRRCQHLMLYSITGCRKRDYPPTFSDHSSWWPDYKVLEDYFARLAVCTSEGKVRRDILVLHPMSSIWMKSGSSASEDFSHLEMNMGWLDDHIVAQNEAGEKLNLLAKSLLAAQYDFDFGDELIMEEIAKVVDNQMVIGEGHYSTIVISHVSTIFESTFHLLKDFLSNGGKIIWVGAIAEFIDGVQDKRVSTLYNYESFYRVESNEDLLFHLERYERSLVHISTNIFQRGRDFLSMVREVTGGYVVIVTYQNRVDKVEVKIELGCTGLVTKYDPLTNEFTSVKVKTDSEKLCFIDRFTPVTTYVYMIDCMQTKEDSRFESQNIRNYSREPQDFTYTHPHAAEKIWLSLGPVAKVYRTMENVLTLDQCQYRLFDEPWSDYMDVWRAQRCIREELNLQQIYYNGAPQRYQWIHQECEKNGAWFALMFEFELSDELLDPLYVVVEKSDGLKIVCNGENCVQMNDFFMDRKMHKFKVSNSKKGKNELILHGLYKNERELEDVYIIGDFDVDKHRRIAPTSEFLHFGDWTLQGLFHYPGNVIYHFDILNEPPIGKKVFMNIERFEGSLLKVKINEYEPIVIINQKEQRIEITKYLNDTKQTIDIEVVGSPRNMFGPLHQTYTGCSRISWEDFRTEDTLYTQEYMIKPYGLMSQIVLVLEE